MNALLDIIELPVDKAVIFAVEVRITYTRTYSEHIVDLVANPYREVQRQRISGF